MASISPEMAERAALGPGEGLDSKLIEVISSKGPANLALGADTARRTVQRAFNVAPEDIVSAEYAGRGDHGDPVFLVTWRLKGES